MVVGFGTSLPWLAGLDSWLVFGSRRRAGAEGQGLGRVDDFEPSGLGTGGFGCRCGRNLRDEGAAMGGLDEDSAGAGRGDEIWHRKSAGIGFRAESRRREP